MDNRFHDSWVGLFFLFSSPRSVGTIDKMKKKITEWKTSLSDFETFSALYFFVFDYLRGDQKNLGIAANCFAFLLLPAMPETMIAWQILDIGNRWKLWPKWLEFIKSEDRKAITRDTWRELVSFMKQYPNDITNYDPTGNKRILFAYLSF